LSPLRKQGQESIICTGFWIPAPRFCGDKFTPAKAGAGMTDKSASFQQSMKESKIRKRNNRRFSRLKTLCKKVINLFVIPAKAGIQKLKNQVWIPACAGMTKSKQTFSTKQIKNTQAANNRRRPGKMKG
jgi:hypothetical protein